MTREEYLEKTEIKSIDEARKRLSHLRILFVLVFVAMVLIRGLNELEENLYLLSLLAYLAFLAYFVSYCAKTIKLTARVTRANAVWSIILAPISWLWFYPEITKPLKVIIGELPVPEGLYIKPTAEIDDGTKGFFSGRYWRVTKIVLVCCLAVLGLAISFVVIDSQSRQGAVTTKSVIPTPPTNKVLSYRYVSSDSGFAVSFPEAPSREEHEDAGTSGTGFKYITYESSDGENLYYVIHYSFEHDSGVGENEDYDIKTGLEATLNAFSNGINGSSIASSNFTSFLGHQALDFSINTESKTIDGTLFFSGSSLYMLAIEYPLASTEGPGLSAFKSGFTLTRSTNMGRLTEGGSASTQLERGRHTLAAGGEDRVVESVVNILCSDGQNVSGGSGTIMTSSGLIMTNSHIIPKSQTGRPAVQSCLVTLPDKDGKPKEVYYGKPIIIPGTSEVYDLAFVRLNEVYTDDEGKTYGVFPNSFPSFFPNGCTNQAPRLGERIRVYGYPAISGGGYFLTLTEGLVSSLPNDGTIVTSAKINHGSSGGLAVDDSGCLVGVPSMISGDENESFGVLISAGVVGEFIDTVLDDQTETGN